MVSVEHEVVVRLLRDDPRLLVELLRTAFGFELGMHVELVDRSENLTELAPPEYRADAVLVKRRPDGTAIEGFVVEVQLQADVRKRYTWPQYVTGLHARLRCPVTLVVFAPDEPTARWCTAPIEFGRACVVTPFVIGPAEVPRILSVDDAASWPELAVLSSITHGNARPAAEAAAVAAAALTAAGRLDDPRGTLYADIVLAALGTAARAILEAQMRIEGYVYKTDFLRRAFDEGEEKGRAEGARRTLLVVLESRGLWPTAEELRRIADCSSESMLDTWVRKALVVDRVADLFE